MIGTAVNPRKIPEASPPSVLALETAGLACSAVVAAGETILCAERVDGPHGQAEALLPIIDAVVRKAGLTRSALDLVAVSVGPGSFTGIRVGLAAARGIVLATGCRIVGVSNFEAVAAGFCMPNRHGARSLLIALESRREDIYVQLFDSRPRPVGPPTAVMPTVLAEMVREELGVEPLLIAGDAAQRAARAVAHHGDAVVLEDSAPDAAGVLLAGLRRWQSCELGAPRPLYLRLPDVTVAGRPHIAPPGRG